MIERFETYAIEEKDDVRTRFNFVDSSTESDEIKITTLLVPDCQIDKAALERELEEMIESLKKEEEDQIKRNISEEYWSLWLDVVNVWREYQSVKALYINATSPETESQVKDVVCQYYDGCYWKIKGHRDELSKRVDSLLKELNCDLTERKFGKITRNWLFNQIGSQRQARKARRKINANLKKHAEPEDFKSIIEAEKNPK